MPPFTGRQPRFLSTPSGWRATGFGKLNVDRLGISIHALRVEGDFCPVFGYIGTTDISIHALRVEGDTNRFFEGDGETISIHALRVEGDCNVYSI